MKKYAIIKNDYNESQTIAKKLEKIHLQKGWTEDLKNPDFVFIIGGDGTFLRAVEKYNNNLDKILFVPFKSGGIGFYTNHNNLKEEETIINVIKRGNFETNSFDVLLCKVDNDAFLAVNEIKVVSDLRARDIFVSLNDEFLQVFKGTGICVATNNGSTGFNKSNSGAIFVEKLALMQMTEIGAVNNNTYHSVQSPIILSKDVIIKLKIESSAHSLIVDTKKINIKKGQLEISLIPSKVKIISTVTNPPTKIQLLRDIFIKDGHK
ncbi:hypothetical protein [Spiroplasma endosymbiont of Panorpa germanica]|uniref:hypothetical protein n=1 Tax=Spiroplasma endosymbiont of Panorpa germanica TaxID=3066314 RepID=UPI0030D2AEEA